MEMVEDLEFRSLVFVSDRNQSLLKSVCVVFPKSHHGHCIYHLSQNVKESVSGKKKDTVATEFMKCACAYTKVEFLKLYSAFRLRYPTAAAYLDKSSVVDKWARCHFPGDRYNIVTTNSVESVNGVFTEARKYTLLPMNDMILEKVAEWFNTQRKASSRIPESQKLVPRVHEVIETNVLIGRKLLSQELNSSSHEYNVIGVDGKNYIVNLSDKTCSCKYFDIDMYPCVHAIQAIIRLSGEEDVHHYEFASRFYWMEMWAMGYTRTIYPVPHFTAWHIPLAELNEIHYGLPPVHVEKKGRTQEKRAASVREHGHRGTGRGGMWETFTAGDGVQPATVHEPNV